MIRACHEFKASNLDEIHYYYRDNPKSVTRTLTPELLHRLVIKKIGIEIHRRKINLGIDLFLPENFWALHNLVNKHVLPLTKNKGAVYNYLMINQKRKSAKFKYLMKSLRANPFQIKPFYYLIK